MKIAVFCSSRDDIDRNYKTDAEALGRWIGSRGHTLVYGGVDRGLMRIVARATRQSGGHVTGVVPRLRLGAANPSDDETVTVSDLYERKRTMEHLADAFIALAGGYGTLDELISTWTSLTFNGIAKPVIAIDRDGLYTPLQTMIGQMVERRLMDTAVASNISFVSNVNAATELIDKQKNI